jgi:2-polyprenyl-3-methyl-5-hydroxy-6-metoxy-1,4-benzoquinol methylase
MALEDVLVRTIGWPATVLHGDPCVFDRWRWVRRHLRRGPLRTLDAGSGSGAFVLYAARVGNEAVGLSFDARNNDTARRRAELLGIEGARFVDCDLRELERVGADWQPFDQVLCLETLEHIADDAALVRALGKLVRPGGTLLVTSPFKHYRGLLGDEVEETEEHGGHVRRGYTHEELRRLLQQGGFTVVREEWVSGIVSQQLTNLMRLLNRVHGRLGWAATFPLRVLQALDPVATRATGYPYLDVAVVGVKEPQ